MFPAQALAEAMLARGWRVKLSTDARGARYTGGFPHTTEIEEINSATFARGGVMAKLMVPFRIASGVMSATFEDVARQARCGGWLWRLSHHSGYGGGDYFCANRE